jgi:hypothetical protein
VVASIEQLRSSAGWRAYLDARTRFRPYSPRNVLLILQQHPSATRVGVSGVARPRVVCHEGVDGDLDLGALPAEQTPNQGVARRRR